MEIYDTICAISTPPGVGGIAVVRVSGTQAVAIVNTLFHPQRADATLLTQAANTIAYGSICDDDAQELDQVVVARYNAPHSYTGEDTIEISCHGSHYIQQQLLQLLIAHGCRLAHPGEFTRRAFTAGKFDLSQAEAVADLIASHSAASHRQALTQMRGAFASRLSTLRAQLLHFVSLIELELDFSEEEVEFADRARLLTLAQEIHTEITTLASTFAVGNALKNGIPTALVGETNAGKSTLLNVLLREERALVSDIPGTTRDSIEDTYTLRGTTFRFIDTAGLRTTQDTIENMGIALTYRKIEQADIVLWVIDATRPLVPIEQMAQQLAPLCQTKTWIVVLNKTDLPQADSQLRATLAAHYPTAHIVELSARTGHNLPLLEETLLAAAATPQNTHDLIVTNARHYQALTHAGQALQRVIAALESNTSGELIAQDIRQSLHYIGEITGEINTDDILGNIFHNFCIGK